LKRCILIVEDNLLNRELLRDWLEVEGYEVWSASDLQTSYEVFAKRIPNAVLLDINLGQDDGLDLLAWMRQKPETREIPVIAVTAHALVAEQERILKAGCGACLSKPVDFQLLREELDRWLPAVPKLPGVWSGRNIMPSLSICACPRQMAWN
jgi:two-component system cell cycle response regulator DivK